MDMVNAGDEQALLDQLGRALDKAPRSVRAIEVGIGLSIALGRQRPVVACGGCQEPLSFRGIPATTNSRLREPFRLILKDA
ncbi:MAG: hypothetical protein WCA77_00275 [Thermoplasmata archaeon]